MNKILLTLTELFKIININLMHRAEVTELKLIARVILQPQITLTLGIRSRRFELTLAVWRMRKWLIRRSVSVRVNVFNTE